MAEQKELACFNDYNCQKTYAELWNSDPLFGIIYEPDLLIKGLHDNASDGYKMELIVSILNRISQADKRSK